MTLSSVPRYNASTPSRVGEHAVVIGASMAGLCTARVLSDAYDTVTVVDRDPLPDEAVARKGVPQADHFHALLEGARVTLEDLFPGFGEELLDEGGLLLDASREAKFYLEGGYIAHGEESQPAFAATRPLYEYVVRQRVRGLSTVDLRPQCQCTDYRLDEDGTTVNGVTVRGQDGSREQLAAELMVDATGRTSRTPDWLERQGYSAPPVDEVHIDVAYSTTYIDRPAEERWAISLVPTPGRPRGGIIAPVEGDRWLMTLWGMHGDDPPTEADAFEDFAASLPVPEFGRLLAEHSWRTEDIAHYPFPSNLRRRYEALSRFPEGLIVIGDAIASFNPIYGQGMSVAALEALELHHSLAAAGTEDLAARFFERCKEPVDGAWNLATRSDHRFPQTQGPKPRWTDVMNWYFSRFLRQAHEDVKLAEAFMDVQMMKQPPSSLLRPDLLWRVFTPS